MSKIANAQPSKYLPDLPLVRVFPRPPGPVPERQRPSLGAAAATITEILWAVLLVVVISFLISKGPAFNAVADDLAAAVHEGRNPAAAAGSQTQAQELALRLARDENMLAALERKYSDLKHRTALSAPRVAEARPRAEQAIGPSTGRKPGTTR